ncbi:hypothetical protein PENPOL_c013G07922 [Penicillium polonicum]|uniref:Uncharacterized protein n=1 Tax=Penicillium polonicum TaxID=60169 RepID=A0A1V6NC33_PENPO|nr:hypothetical protein PENPOL_c013G07922 [Penicillium polonicum]
MEAFHGAARGERGPEPRVIKDKEDGGTPQVEER